MFPLEESKGLAVQIEGGRFTWTPTGLMGWQTELPKSRVELAQEKKNALKAKEDATQAGAEDGDTQQNPVGDATAAIEATKGEEKEVSEAEGEEAETDSGFNLVDVNINVQQGQLVAIVGSVGCGKSSFLQAVLNEMHKTEGAVRVWGRTSYASQQAWIQNATVRE